MKKILFFVGLAIVVAIGLSLYPATVKAAAYSYWYQDGTNNEIDTRAGTSPEWVHLYFPQSTTGNYPSGSFEYDDYVSSGLNLFTITLFGNSDNSSEPIDIYLDKNGDHSSYSGLIASKNVGNFYPFTLTLDIKNNDFLYSFNGGPVQNLGDLANVDLNWFVGLNDFYVGYSCHFWHDATRVDVGVEGTNGKVPEPSTMLLLGSGLIGLGGYVRRKFKK